LLLLPGLSLLFARATILHAAPEQAGVLLLLLGAQDGT
jgi:hypothetical protein